MQTATALWWPNQLFPVYTKTDVAVSSVFVLNQFQFFARWINFRNYACWHPVLYYLDIWIYLVKRGGSSTIWFKLVLLWQLSLYLWTDAICRPSVGMVLIHRLRLRPRFIHISCFLGIRTGDFSLSGTERFVISGPSFDVCTLVRCWAHPACTHWFYIGAILGQLSQHCANIESMYCFAGMRWEIPATATCVISLIHGQ